MDVKQHLADATNCSKLHKNHVGWNYDTKKKQETCEKGSSMFMILVRWVIVTCILYSVSVEFLKDKNCAPTQQPLPHGSSRNMSKTKNNF